MAIRDQDMDELRDEVKNVLVRDGYERRPEPFQLASGQWSLDYIDGKKALARAPSLRVAARCILAVAGRRGVSFEAVGGLTMGADPLAHAVALLSETSWFSVRKEPKRHGTQRMIEGAELGGGTRVLLVDDVITTGASIIKALDVLEPIGPHVVLAVSLVDRGDAAGPRLEARGIPYEPLLTYRDLGIEPVGVDLPARDG